MTVQTYHIEGLSCAGCATSATSMLSHIEGIKTVHVNFASKAATIELEEAKEELVSLELMNKELAKVGFQLVPKTAEAEEDLAKKKD